MQDRLEPDLNARIACRWHQCRRSRMPLALLQLEVRNLDEWRDNVGSAVARSLLDEFGRRLKRRVRDTDEVLSLDGGRFAVLLPGAGASESAIVRARLEAALTAPYRIGTLLLCPRLALVERLWVEEDAADRPPAPRLAAAG
jgi:GGDEF domain-containing protein